MAVEPAPHTDGRRERRRLTRQRIVRASYRLFCDQGLDVPMTAIAEEAGVSVPTLYVSYGTKIDLLRAALQYAVHGDDLPVPPHQRPWFDQMVAEPDPRRALGILLRSTQGIYDRLAPFAGVFRTSTPEVAEIWRRSEELRWDGMNLMTKALLAKGRRRRNLSTRAATDIVFVLLGPDSYQSFVNLGWTPGRWQHWVTATLEHSLFEP